jgi:polar amino acid transport system permease protein
MLWRRRRIPDSLARDDMLDEVGHYLWGQAFDGGAAVGLVINVLLTFFGLACGVVIGVPLGVLRGMAPPWMHAPFTAIFAVVRATPLLLLILWLYLFIEVVLSLRLSPNWVGAIALGLFSATWISDAFLAGTRAVPPDQIRAARALGFGSLGIARYVIVPIAWRAMLPTLTSFATTLFKDSSFCYVIGVIELMQVGVFKAAREPSRVVEIYTVVGLLFFAFAFAGTRLAARLERRARIRGLLS